MQQTAQQILEYPPETRHWLNLGDEVIALDVETTGTNPKNDRIVSLGLCNTGTMEIKHWIIDPKDVKSSDSALHTHGITQERILAEARDLSEIWQDIEDFCDGQHIIAHNAIFDFQFLKNSLDRDNITCSQGFHRRNWTDTLRVVRFCMPDRVSYALDRVVRYLHLDIPERDIHNAGEDSHILAQCWNSDMLREQWDRVHERQRPQCNLENILPSQ